MGDDHAVRKAAEESFREFVERRSGALLRTAWFLTGSAHDAEDLVQSALGAAWQHWPRVTAESDGYAYVRTIMARRASHARRRLLFPHVPAKQGSTIVNSFTDTVINRIELRTALLSLPLRQRTAVVLRYIEDCSEREVAAAMGCSVGTVKSQVSKGLMKLSAAMTTTERRATDEH